MFIGPCSSDCWKDNPDPEMNSETVSDNCKPTRIESTTTFRTTNVSVVAPYLADLGIPDSSSEGSEDSVFAVKRYVHVT